MRLQRILALLKAFFLFGLFLALFLVYLPWVLAIRDQSVSYAGTGWLRLVGIVPLVGGSFVALHCVFSFAWYGLGTPVPVDPPRNLVVRGFYRYVRNPMFLGVTLAIVGELILFGAVGQGMVYAILFVISVLLFILLYEEPVLRSKFGADYEEYCRNVPRLIPRQTPWEPAGDRPRSQPPEATPAP